jgi:hypothetical protein
MSEEYFYYEEVRRLNTVLRDKIVDLDSEITFLKNTLDKCVSKEVLCEIIEDAYKEGAAKASSWETSNSKLKVDLLNEM